MIVLIRAWGWKGLGLTYTWMGLVGVWYFSLALMNHNARHTLDVHKRNKARDWGEAQLHSSVDWAVSSTFAESALYLWLNYHTVHHLCPRVDMSHHPAIQKILIETCKEFDTPYTFCTASQAYWEMIESFGSPLSLGAKHLKYIVD